MQKQFSYTPLDSVYMKALLVGMRYFYFHKVFFRATINLLLKKTDNIYACNAIK